MATATERALPHRRRRSAPRAFAVFFAVMGVLLAGAIHAAGPMVKQDPISAPPKGTVWVRRTTPVRTERPDAVSTSLRQGGPTGPGVAEQPAATPATVTPPRPTWQAFQGSTLRQVIQSWSARAGWTLRWESAGVDYPIVAPLTYQGSYIDATSDAISAYAQAPKPLWVCLYTKQHLTRVTSVPCKTESDEQP